LIGLGFLSAVLGASILAASQSAANQEYTTWDEQPGDEATSTPSADNINLAVVKEIDAKNNHITLFDVNRNDEIVLSYSNGTNIRDKYGKDILMNQVTIGSMVDYTYQQDINKLTGMNISTKAWEYAHVNNMSMNRDDQIMKIASTKYKYTDNLCVLDGKEFVTASELAEQDELTVWGYKQTVWSVIVTKGHGTVELMDYEDYLGDFISIGYESMQQITDNMKITVREGDFNLTVANGNYSATKPVTIKRNEITYVSLSDLGPDGLKLGVVTFKIKPEGADLYIDGKLTSYTDPVELSYGDHKIAAALGGYTTYQGTIDVDSDDKVVKINLPEETSEDTATVTETNSDAGTDTTDTGADNSDTNTTDSSSDNTSSEINDSAHKIYVQKPSGASVYLDGDYMGMAPCSFDKVTGSHVLTFIKDGYKTTSYTVEVSNDGKDAYFTFPNLSKSN
jgi:hypothetical protein